MDGWYYVLAVNICLWLAIFGYLIYLQSKCRKLNDMIEAMKKKTNVVSDESSNIN